MHSQAPKLKIKTKRPTNVLALSNQNDVEKQNENAEIQHTLKATPMWLKVWQQWVTEKKVSDKL